MTKAGFRRWCWVHKWSSVVSTAFLLVICITGLPLVFKDEIGDFLEGPLPWLSAVGESRRRRFSP